MQYVNPRKNPPPFSSLKSYEQWRKEVEAWTKLTKEDEEDWAKLVALGCLSPDDPSGIRDKIFTINLDPDPEIPAVQGQGVDNVGAVAAEGEGALDVLVLEFVAASKASKNITDILKVEREGKRGLLPRRALREDTRAVHGPRGHKHHPLRLNGDPRAVLPPRRRRVRTKRLDHRARNSLVHLPHRAAVMAPGSGPRRGDPCRTLREALQRAMVWVARVHGLFHLHRALYGHRCLRRGDRRRHFLRREGQL